jgi:hypothetical protein
MKRCFPCAGARALHAPTRRDFIYSLGASLGSVAFTSLLAAEEKKNPLAPKLPMLPTKAKACIFLMMEGGPSHIDTFDPKPKLAEMHLKEFVRERLTHSRPRRQQTHLVPRRKFQTALAVWRECH